MFADFKSTPENAAVNIVRFIISTVVLYIKIPSELYHVGQNGYDFVFGKVLNN